MLQVPKLGFARALLGGREGYLVLMVAILVLGGWVLVDVWRKPAKPSAEPPAAGGDG